ncbi:PQQ-dependent sugar dehydrogenase [Calidifontibacter terrae]
MRGGQVTGWVLLAGLVAGCSTPTAIEKTTSATSTPLMSSAADTGTPHLQVTEVVRGLDNPWDIAFLPDRSMLVSERSGRLRIVPAGSGTAHTVRADLSEVRARGEGGLMGLILSPDFTTSREFLTCQTWQGGAAAGDIRVVRWRLAADGSSATVDRPLLTGIPLSDSGRHSGCRLLIGPDGALYVGTGDTASARVPQDLTSLGGKILRLNALTGEPMPDNPYATAANHNERYVWSYGHRNVQGLTTWQGKVVSAEHGPDNNDEVNLDGRGINFGWDPSRGSSRRDYDESVSMTDLTRFPQARSALWSSGSTTQAICAITTLQGAAWGRWNGAFVVTALKGAKLLLLTPGPDGRPTRVEVPPQTNGPYGRLRAARQGPDGALYVSTSNGSDDAILRISPN